jgi:hypothetical protein
VLQHRGEMLGLRSAGALLETAHSQEWLARQNK